MQNFKKIFTVLFITALSVLIVSQIMLKNTFYKTKLSMLHKIEAKYVYSEKDTNSGYIIIEVYYPSENIFLMQNGERILSLSDKKIKVDVSDNSVIEIDGRNTDSKCLIKVTEISDNINGFYEKEITVESNIVILGRFFVK